MNRDAIKILHASTEKAKLIDSHSVVLLWVNPAFSPEVNHVVAYCEEYYEAERYAKFLQKTCRDSNGPDAKISVYVDNIFIKE